MPVPILLIAGAAAIVAGLLGENKKDDPKPEPKPEPEPGPEGATGIDTPPETSVSVGSDEPGELPIEQSEDV